jgi:hypothetical protein
MMKTFNEIEKLPNLNEKGSALPYIFGWLMGVPGSVLFLIFLFRSCGA